MKLAFSCPKCRCRHCEEKSIILPGYTEFYSAKIVDDETEKKCKDNAEPEGSY